MIEEVDRLRHRDENVIVFKIMPHVHLEPDDDFTFTRAKGRVLLIACGALAREIVDLIEMNRWQAFDIQCLPAIWHNRPEKIAPGVRDLIRKNRDSYRKIYVLYGDCGTGGELDKVLAEEGVERIDGPHCYSFFSGNGEFARRHEDDMTAFFLTDYLARHFDKLIWQGLGLHLHPELLPLYFGNYTKVVYVAQTRDPVLEEDAKAAAAKLGLLYEHRHVGYGDLEKVMRDNAGNGD
jgi:hypothetical protein